MIETGFFDLDKTTVDERGRIYEGLGEALDSRPDFIRTIITARGLPRYHEAISENRSLAVTPHMPVALENGARIVDSETYRNLYYHPLSSDERAAVCDFIQMTMGLRYVAFHSEDPHMKTLLWSPDRDEALHLQELFSHNADVFTGSKEDLYRAINQHNPCMITCRTYEAEPQQLPEVTFYSSGSTVNFIPKSVSKGTAVRMIAEMRGIDLSRTMVVGNDHNDLPMLRLEGLGCPVVVGTDMYKYAAQLPEHAIYIPDPKKLGNFVLQEVKQ